MMDRSISDSTSLAEDMPELELALTLRDQLVNARLRLVLVESCTAGRVAACLGVLPGISQWLCGSLVVYRSGSKAAWLGVPDSLLDDPRRGPVSAAASHWLARAAIERTPEADLALAITGDVGPGAPAETDGCIFLAAALRHNTTQHASAAVAEEPSLSTCTIIEKQQRLSSPAPRDRSDIAARQARLDEATRCALKFACQVITSLHVGS